MPALPIDISLATDEELENGILDYYRAMFAPEGGATINTINLYFPLIQIAVTEQNKRFAKASQERNEQTGKFVKRTTWAALAIAAISLIVSFAALYVAASSSYHNPSAQHSHIPAARYGAVWGR